MAKQRKIYLTSDSRYGYTNIKPEQNEDARGLGEQLGGQDDDTFRNFADMDYSMDKVIDEMYNEGGG